MKGKVLTKDIKYITPGTLLLLAACVGCRMTAKGNERYSIKE